MNIYEKNSKLQSIMNDLDRLRKEEVLTLEQKQGILQVLVDLRDIRDSLFN